MIRFGRLVAFGVLLCVLFPPARAQQLSLADLQSKFVGPWLATVEGESRTRNLIIDVVAQKSEGAFLMTGSFTFSDNAGRPVAFKNGEITQSSGNLTLAFATSVGSVYAGTLKSDGTVMGTTKYTNGQEKPFKLEKGAQAPAMVASSSGFLGKQDYLARVSGKEIIFARARDMERIAWALAAGGDFTARNFNRKSDDFGTWQIDERGALCMKFNRSGAGCYFLKVVGEKAALYTNLRADAPVYGEIESIK